MGLEDLTLKVGDVSSSKTKTELDEDTLLNLYSYSPEYATMITSNDTEDIKFHISLIDKVILNNVRGINISDDVIREAKNIREKLLDELHSV